MVLFEKDGDYAAFERVLQEAVDRLNPRLLAVLRYVERNPLRANLVQRARHWR